MNRVLVSCLLIIAWFLASTPVGPLRAENWPQWRGPNNDGVSKETNLPSHWGADKNIVWKLKLPGMGSSTPAVWGKRLFLTSQDGLDLVLLCVSTDGKPLWKRSLGKGGAVYRGGEGNQASASPSTDGKHVYVFAGNGVLACFEVGGKEVWKFNVQKRYGRFNIQFGMHSTPVLDGDRLYLQFIHSGGAKVIALNKANGKEVWQVARKSDGRAECEHSYASPCLWRKGEKAYLITHGNDYAIAHRLKDGKEIWRVGGLNPKDHYNFTLRFVASPVATADLIVIPSAKGGPVVGLKPTARGKVMPGSRHEQWRMKRNTPDVPSPLVHGGLVYLCREFGVLICLDARTGKEYYSKRIHGASYRASPVYADGKIYLTARDGTFTVVKAGRKFEQLAVNRLPDDFTASPVVSGGRIYLRGFKTLYAVGKPK
jgi:outer membrane protein assembly factor BamB